MVKTFILRPEGPRAAPTGFGLALRNPNLMKEHEELMVLRDCRVGQLQKQQYKPAGWGGRVPGWQKGHTALQS